MSAYEGSVNCEVHFPLQTLESHLTPQGQVPPDLHSLIDSTNFC